MLRGVTGKGVLVGIATWIVLSKVVAPRVPALQGLMAKLS